LIKRNIRSRKAERNLTVFAGFFGVFGFCAYWVIKLVVPTIAEKITKIASEVPAAADGQCH
jgi:hypothetical protein